MSLTNINTTIYKKDGRKNIWVNIVNKDFTGCDLKILANNHRHYVIRGQVKNYLRSLANNFNLYLQYWSPNQCTARYNHHLSKIPYSTEDIAYENTPNKGVARIVNGLFEFQVSNPNCYYSKMGTKYNPPLVKFRFTDYQGRPVSSIYTVPLESGNEHFDIHRKKGGVNLDAECKSQEQIFLESVRRD